MLTFPKNNLFPVPTIFEFVLSCHTILVNMTFDSMAANVGDSEITKSDKYSILLPTYNERENLPIIIWLIIKYLDNRYNIIT